MLWKYPPYLTLHVTLMSVGMVFLIEDIPMCKNSILK